MGTTIKRPSLAMDLLGPTLSRVDLPEVTIPLEGPQLSLPDNTIPLPDTRPIYTVPGIAPKEARPIVMNERTVRLPTSAHTSPTRSFTGSDIKAVVHVLGNGGQTQALVLANVQTLSYSIHREKVPVRALGHTYAVGFCRGQRTIAGSIVFTMFDREVLWEIIQSYAPDTEWSGDDQEYSTRSPLLDQLPPFDITVTFANEYGDVANMAIYGVELVDEGTVLSVDDMLVEKTVSFVARDIDMVRPYEEAPNFRAFGRRISSKVPTQDDYNTFLNSLLQRRQAINNPNGDSVWRYDIPYDYAMFSQVAATSRKVERIPMGAKVTYEVGGVHWFGSAFPVEGSPDYEFILDITRYPPHTTLANTRVHSDYVEDRAPRSGDIPSEYTLKLGTTSAPIIVGREEVAISE